MEIVTIQVVLVDEFYFYMHHPIKACLFEKNYLWTSLSFSYSLKITCILLRQGVIQKVRLLRRRGGRDHWKTSKNEYGEGSPSICVRSRFSEWSFIVFLQFFLLIIMAIWNIKQTIMKDYDIQSCQWMACDRFRQPTQDHQCGLC